MLISKHDIATITAVIESADQSHDENELKIRDGILWLRIRGNLQNGITALKALNGAGINQVVDQDFSTLENSVIYADGADFATVWIDVVDNQPLFRPL